MSLELHLADNDYLSLSISRLCWIVIEIPQLLPNLIICCPLFIEAFVINQKTTPYANLDLRKQIYMECTSMAKFALSKGKSVSAEAIKSIESPGSRYFCESFYGPPSPTSGKNYATANACGCPSRPGHSIATQQGVAHMLSNDSTRFRKACIFTSQAA
ncbi:hypothetical protein [Methylobacter sp.]|uniref:hypothetical protein n=1 Tax=Methylobacter sp. TaxID=2051955 RepID=UPI002FDE896C